MGSLSQRREREIRETCLKSICMKKKGHPTPPYIGQGGVPPSLQFWGGTNPKGGGKWRSPKGGGPPHGAMAHGGGLPLPLMGPMRPICLFFHF